MKVLVINCGSSSLKYQLIDMTNEEVIAKGNYERIGEEAAFVTHKVDGEKYVLNNPVKNHEEAFKFIIEQLTNNEYGVIADMSEINAVGHRIAHGGEKIKGSCLITEEVEEEIAKCKDLAPIHIPAGLTGIHACRKLMPNVPMVAVFDTTFHQTIPEERYIYPIPYEYYEKYGARKYGFHGTSHLFVSRRVAEIVGKPVEELKTIVCHLGQGASLCAVEYGKSVDTSMGMTPIAGIPMCARVGDMDPGLVIFLAKKTGMSLDELETTLNKKSGVLGISGVSADFRDIEKEAANGNKRAQLAIDVYCYTVAQYIAKYAVAMNGIDVIAFTAGIGENQLNIRKQIISHLEFLGVKIDVERNNVRDEAKISSDDSRIGIYVVPTNEELMIARDTLRLCK